MYKFKKTANIVNCEKDNLFDSLKYAMMEICDSFSNTDCLVEGVVQTWNFPFGCEIAPTFFQGIDFAICELIRKSDSDDDDVVITLENGAFKLTCPHHDGTNTFTIRALNDRGLRVVNNHREFGDYLKGITPKAYWFAKCYM